MTQYSKFNIIYRLQKWLDSVPGQTFMNYAYSWGASIVILGTLFKLTHLPGANFMLFLGMGTEVVVFFIAAFDRPFDKTADGMDLATHVGESAIIAGVPGSTEVPEGIEKQESLEGSSYQGPAVIGGGGVIGGGVIGGGGTVIIGGGGVAGAPQDGGQIAAFAVGAEQAVPSVNPELEEAASNYVEELKNLTEMLHKVSEQSERLTRDSEEMENLNRTLTGICKIYEMQLKGASAQIGTIDEINEQTRKMADQIAELNQIYTRMIEAMTVNMPKAPSL